MEDARETKEKRMQSRSKRSITGGKMAQSRQQKSKVEEQESRGKRSGVETRASVGESSRTKGKEAENVKARIEG